MDSIANKSKFIISHSNDFTIDNYRHLLKLAHQNWPLVNYDSIPFEKSFLLWRHDCDASLNRALAIGKVENEEGVSATYFVNPHSRFYNLFERKQLHILFELLDLGHEIALHFDCMFYDTKDKSELVSQLESEADLLEKLFNKRPTAFSFHVPNSKHFTFEEESYAGMLNCYSSFFKEKVAYCSDSNGIWRFKNLKDVLIQKETLGLQVATHPMWWHDEPMTPRQRVFRGVFGRADATISFMDNTIEEDGRANSCTIPKQLAFLRENNFPSYSLFDQLFHLRQYNELQIILWSFLFKEINQISKAEIKKQNLEKTNYKKIDLMSPSFFQTKIEDFEKIFRCSWMIVSGQTKKRMEDIFYNTQKLISGEDQVHDDGVMCLELLTIIVNLIKFNKTKKSKKNKI